MSSSHLLAGLPCFRYNFCLVDIAGVHLEMSLVQPAVVVFGSHSCSLSKHPALSEDPRRDPISGLRATTHGFRSSSKSSSGTLSKEWLLVSWLLSSGSLGFCGLASIVSSSDSLSVSCGSSSATSSKFAACAAAALVF